MNADSTSDPSKIECKYHPDSHLIDDYSTGDVICSECGLVVGDRIIEVSAEWRNITDDRQLTDPSRIGAPENPLLSGSDLFTRIGRNGLGTPEDAIFLNYHKKGCSVSSVDRSLLLAFREITDMANRINLTQNIIERAHHLFKQVNDRKALGNRNKEALSAACLYIACRQEGVPRSFKEICAVSTVSKKEIGRCFRMIVKDIETNIDLITSGDFMARFCAHLGLANKVQSAATHIAKKAVDLNLVAGRSPISVAAAAIYMASHAANIKKTTREIGDIAGVAEVTLRQSYRLLYPKALELFPKDFESLKSLENLPHF